jgi:hypothetical protein
MASSKRTFLNMELRVTTWNQIGKSFLGRFNEKAGNQTSGGIHPHTTF